MTQLRPFVCAFLYALLCAMSLSGPVWAQDADRIWGQVHTKSGEVHEGFIRWNRNEVSRVDILGGSKDVPPENYLAWLVFSESSLERMGVESHGMHEIVEEYDIEGRRAGSRLAPVRLLHGPIQPRTSSYAERRRVQAA